MWKKLSIQWQLVLLVFTAMFIVQSVTLVIDYRSDIQQRQKMAIEQARTLNLALQNDLLRAVVDPRADNFSDLSFRIEGFRSVENLVLTVENSEVFQYQRSGFDMPDLAGVQIDHNQPVFIDNLLVMQSALETDGYHFADVSTYINLRHYQTGINQLIFNKLMLFILELAVAMAFAFWFGKNFTKPFSRLAKAMSEADVANASFPTISDDSSNEIGTLYKGYNELTAEITSSTRLLKYLGEHDNLTGLLNRYAIEKAIGKTLQNCDYANSSLALLDVDQFKLINDGAGHPAGDDLLKQISQIIHNVLDNLGNLARIGGDDFLILFENQSREQTEALCRQIQKALNGYRFNASERSFEISISIGLVHFKAGDFSMQKLLLAADSAFYAAKEKGRGKISIYHQDDADMQKYSSDLANIAIVREALSKNGQARFALHAQAIVPLQYDTDKISYEILIRLYDSEGKMVFPDRFLPTANRFQLMTAIDIYVLWSYLETVCTQPQHLQKLAFVNINLAGNTLNDEEFQERLRIAIKTFDFPWEKLVLEVTETSAVGNLAQASHFIEYCRQQGIRVALDDFGTGMASFEYLKHLPLDIVKIDGSFVRDMLEDPIDLAMVQYVNEISKLRNQETIAEFVELEEHANLLRRIGIDYGQGYYLEKPRPLEEWLK